MPDDSVREIWSDDDLDTALATLRSDVDTDMRVLARSRAELLVVAAASAATEPEPEPEPKPVSRRRRTWWAASAATVVAVVAGLLVLRIGDQPVANAVAKELNQAADRISASDEPVGPGQYRYISTHAWSMSTAVLPNDSFTHLEENLVETWVPADERQEWLRRGTPSGNRKWIDGSEEEAAAAGVDFSETGPPVERRAPCGDFSAADEGREPCTRDGSWQIPDERFMASLPRDPNALYDRLREDTDGRGQDPDLEMLVYVADMLSSGRVPADLRAALYRTLGLVPGLEITEKVANLDGRAGVAYGISAAGTRQEVILDPETGHFIGERQILEEGFEGVPPGTVGSYSSVTTAVVDGMGDKPTG